MKNTAANPFFCTELSDKNSNLKEFPSDVIMGGNLDPQYNPCFLISPEPILDESAKLSYSQSCCKEYFQTLKIINDIFYDFTYIISFNIEMCEINSNSPLRRSQNFPNAIFVCRIQIGK